MNRPIQLRRRCMRRASAVVETAVVAPLLILAMFGMVEVGQAYNVKQTVTLAAREGARAAALPGATQADAQAAVDASMGMAGLTGYTMTTNMAGLQPTDTQVWVKVSLPFDRASYTGTMMGGGSYNITSTTTMRREGVDSSSGGGNGIQP
ncbi:MAG TPA: TadE family protein [Phycisphaerae bacterium]|nr:TadE family protein [Phycisphaerae bacterium]